MKQVIRREVEDVIALKMVENSIFSGDTVEVVEEGGRISVRRKEKEVEKEVVVEEVS